MDKQVPIDRSARADETRTEGVHEVAEDLAYQRLAIVNVVYWGRPGGGSWVLIDAGVLGSTSLILKAVEARFGSEARPSAIVMTHGHFDHVGALPELAERWEVPIYAHEMELPYLDGSSSYPPPDPGVGGGMMAALSRFYPTDPVDVRPWLTRLPADGTIPEMPGWQWIHTPGHSAGHISLWREDDRTLVVGDAFVTTRQESAYAVAVQRPELHGPPMYFTPDWRAAGESVRRLAALEPVLVITGHGRALQGTAMRDGLNTLARDFETLAVPEHGRYT